MSLHNRYYFSHARTGLKYGLSSLDLKEGDQILMPDFICSSVLQPIKEIGLNYLFYETLENLDPNWQLLPRLITRKTKAILFVHFFGQPQDLERFIKFSQDHHLFLIEDNAHGHEGSFNGKRLGTYGDIGISSPRKFIGAKGGGVLYLNRAQEIQLPSLDKMQVTNTQKNLSSLLDAFPQTKGLLRKLIKRRPLYEDPYGSLELDVEDKILDLEIIKDLESIDWEEIRTKRRNNYYKWNEFALNNKLTPVYEELNDEANPWCFPAYTSSKEESIIWFKWAWRNNVNVFSWPSLPEEVIKQDASILRRWERLVCFSTA
jgi:hypothetical protein